MNQLSEASKYYDSHAKEFAVQASDAQKNSFEYEKNMPSLISMIDRIEGRILDFGCGAGNFTNMLTGKNRIVEGCDSSKNLLKLASQTYPDLYFFQYDGLSPLKTTTKYDLIIAKLVFHYIDNLDLVIRNLAKSLRVGGLLCFSVPHPDKSIKLLNEVSDETSYVDQVGSFGLTLKMMHRSEGRYKHILEELGFELKGTFVVSDNGRPKRLNILAIKY